jgi:transcription factor E2F7/8
LEELSKRFLNLFEGKDKKLIELDKVTQQLKVEKRRIYDIINILESLRVVSKNGKNHYKWKGLTEAIETIHLCERDRDSLRVESIWKEKSLEYLSSSLLKLFLHWKTTLSL